MNITAETLARWAKAIDDAIMVAKPGPRTGRLIDVRYEIGQAYLAAAREETRRKPDEVKP